jgi:D-sedoheptulose 7-phosphate isomerase
MSGLDPFYTNDAAQFARSYFGYLTGILQKIDPREIAAFIKVVLEARKQGTSVFFIGNGGSASTASHFANDIGIGTRIVGKPFRVLSLCDNTSILTAIGNDFGYDEVFSRQLQMLAKPGDVVVAISASGNSPNIIRAMEWANTNGLTTVGVSGFDGGKLRQIAKHCVHVPSQKGDYGPVEDAHMILDHLVGAYLYRYLREVGDN